MSVVLEGPLNLRSGVYISGDALGMEVPVVIAGSVGSVVLPTLPQPRKREPFDGHDALLAPSLVNKKFEQWLKDTEWGEQRAGNGDSWVQAIMFRFALEGVESLSETSGRELGQRLRAEGDDWQRRLFDWLETVAGQDLDPHEPYRWIEFEPPSLVLWTLDENGKGYEASRPDSVEIKLNVPDAPVSRDQWRFVVAKANDGQETPIEYKLLNSARSALARGHWRRSVLEAATAAEVALTATLQHELSAGRADVAEALLDTHHALIRRDQLCRRLSIALPVSAKDMKEGLAEPRNKAIHAGEDPAGSEAREAYRIARDVVRKLVPIS